MPKANDHISLANKNQSTLDYLLADAEHHSEWIAIVAFYKAVQTAEAMFVCENGKNCHDHGNRLRRLKTGRFKDLYKSYRVLWSASTVARYLEDNGVDSDSTYSQFSDYLKPQDVTKKLISKRLMTFEQLATKFLSDELKSKFVKARLEKVPTPNTRPKTEPISKL